MMVTSVFPPRYLLFILRFTNAMITLPRYRINGNATISQNIPAVLAFFGHGLFKMCRENEMQSLPTGKTGSIDADASVIIGQFSLDI